MNNPYHPAMQGMRVPPGYPQNLPPPPFGFVPPPGFIPPIMPVGGIPPPGFGYIPSMMPGGIPPMPLNIQQQQQMNMNGNGYHQISKGPVTHSGIPTTTGMKGLSPPIINTPPSAIITAAPTTATTALNNSLSGGGVIGGTTSVFIGKIPAYIDDVFIKQLIEQCGPYSKWTRGSDASGKLKGFGFCEFESPEGALRALRLLNELEVDDGKKLSVKVEDKVQLSLNEYIENKKKSKQQQEDQNTTEQQTNTPTTTNQNQNQNNTSSVEKDEIDDIVIKETIKVLVEKQKPIFQESKRNETVQQESVNVDIFSKDRKDLTKDEKLKVIEREQEREIQRERDRDLKRKEREYRDFKKQEENWEQREKTRERDRERDKEKEKEKQKEIKEIRLKDMEDYSDSDEKLRKLYRSDRAMKYRKIEKEEDKIDREKEQEELNILKQAKLQEQLEREKKLKQLDDNLNKIRVKKPILSTPMNSSFNIDQDQDDEYNNIFKKKQTFIPLDYNEIKLNNSQSTITSQMPTMKTKEEIQELISKIPTEKDDVLNMKMEWEIIDKLNIIELKMRTWISKKVTEFMGGTEEPLLINHIIDLLKSHSTASNVINELTGALGAHAEIFVIKMFRMLAFLEKSS